MSNKIRLLYGLYLLCNCAIIAQVSSTVDTIFQVGLGNTIQLSNSFILESSVKVDYLGESLTIESIQSIEGIITLSDSKYDFPIVVHYDYLNKGLPISVGPKWKTLPALGTKISQLNQEISSYAKPNTSPTVQPAIVQALLPSFHIPPSPLQCNLPGSHPSD